MNTLQDHLERLLITDTRIIDAGISHRTNDDTEHGWDAPTLWVYVWRLCDWSTPEGLVEVSEAVADLGKVFGYQLAR